MPRLREIEGAEVRDERGRKFGRVERLLFHPKEPRPVGLQVERARMLYVIPRPQVFLPLSAVRLADGELALVGKAPSRDQSEKELGASWDETVVWRGMPVTTAAGRSLGLVRDADVSLKNARLRTLAVTEGAVADAAVGKRSFDADVVRGFNGEAIVLEDSALAAPPSGGLAATAGTGAAYAKVGAEQLATKAAVASVAAVRAVKKAQVSRRTGKFLGSLKKAMLDGMNEDDEE